MSFFKRDEGKHGEDLAVSYLKKHGYKIIDRNFRIRGGEIDIIGIDPSTGSGSLATLAFIEVKTRRSHEFGTPLEAITPWKVKTLIKAAEFYKLKHPELPEMMRLDAVAVLLDEQGHLASINLVKNIS